MDNNKSPVNKPSLTHWVL